MKNRISINRLMAVMLTALVALSACSDDKQGEQQKQPPLVQTFTVSANDQTVVRHFVARVDALSTVDLSFQVAGRINRLAERQGVVIPKGDLLAALEPQDYELSLKQAEAARQSLILSVASNCSKTNILVRAILMGWKPPMKMPSWRWKMPD